MLRILPLPLAELMDSDPNKPLGFLIRIQLHRLRMAFRHPGLCVLRRYKRIVRNSPAFITLTT